MLEDEERRAAAFRAAGGLRERNRAALVAGMLGSDVAAARVRAGFAPLLPQPLDGWDCPCPGEPAPPAWLGRVPRDVELPEYLKKR